MSEEQSKWEYITASSTSGFTVERLNEKGQMGWECVGSVPGFYGQDIKKLAPNIVESCLLLFRRGIVDETDVTAEPLKWEYIAESSPDGFTVERLGEMSQKGWECVGSVNNLYGKETPCILLYKRRLS